MRNKSCPTSFTELKSRSASEDISCLKGLVSVQLGCLRERFLVIKLLNLADSLSRDNNAEGIVFRKRFNGQETFGGG